jgi:hypothetical protein
MLTKQLQPASYDELSDGRRRAQKCPATGALNETIGLLDEVNA